VSSPAGSPAATAARLSHLLLAHSTVRGVLQAALLLAMVWLVWAYTTWVTNWMDPERLEVRLLLVAAMLISLSRCAARARCSGITSASSPGAWSAAPSPSPAAWSTASPVTCSGCSRWRSRLRRLGGQCLRGTVFVPYMGINIAQ
jgi:hypothetical protein